MDFISFMVGAMTGFLILSILAAKTVWALRRMNSRLNDEIAVHKKASELDPLTKLPNRRFFDMFLSNRLTNSGQRNSDRTAVLFLDLDGFKDVNDKYGHDVGDRLLVNMAYTLQSCVRDGDVVSRFGGDEFVIALTNFKTDDNVLEIAQRIVESVSQPIELNNVTIRVTASLGVSCCLASKASPIDIVNDADTGMYMAKKNGKNKIYWHRGDNKFSDVTEMYKTA